LVSVLRIVLYVFLGLPLLTLVWLTMVRIARVFFKFPMPHFLANAIDNPVRHKIQPPDEMPARHGIQPGMTVLEVGPGNGTYTVATARWVGDGGRVIAIDIEPKMVERARHRAQVEGIENIEARVTDVFDLPFADGYFDAVYMIAVIGEIPTPEKAMQEFHRVLSPSGTLAFSELFPDPDYRRPKTLIKMAARAGFKLKQKTGNFFSYTVVFEKLEFR
jgi:ubiquinone/menaquinone biosynthesis C-methylase UbiE